MSSWGTGIFQNDVAEGVKTYYKNKLRRGTSDEQALEEILGEDYLVDDDDRFDFWFGLASTMFDLERLTDYVRNKALELLKNGGDIKQWDKNPK